jgi:alanyl-tRNA synthetase
VGKHVEQKGSYVSHERFRFDFSHFSKVTDEQLAEVEMIVNQLVRDNTSVTIFENLPIEEAKGMGAMALFGEKYGDHVRVIRFGESIELCGGTHTSATGNIGYIKIVSESAIAAGIRRIEAISGKQAEIFINENIHLVNELKGFFASPNIMGAIQKMNEETDRLKKELEEYQQEKIQHFAKEMVNNIQEINDIHVIRHNSDLLPEIMKQAAYKIKNHTENLLVVFGSTNGEKPNLIVALSDDLVAKGMNASQLVREAAALIQGGGGGQPNLATAGGKNVNGMEAAIQKVIEKGCSVA